MERLKVFIPTSAKDYKKGYGEACYCLVSEDVKTAYDREATGGNYTGILDSQSVFYYGLEPGQELPLKLQGIDSPIVPYEALKHYPTLLDKIKKLAEDLEEQS